MKLYNELADYYFAIESHHRNINDDIEFIVSASKNAVGTKLIDLGCGSGEHCYELSKRGFQCTGIDISERMIQIAHERFSTAGTFLHLDILKLTFKKEFDVAISLFGTLNYFTKNDEMLTAFANTKASLKKGGIAIFEIWNSFPVNKIRRKKLSHISTTQSGSTTIERYRGFSLIQESPHTIVEVHYRYMITNSTGTQEIIDRHIMRAFSQNEIAEFLKSTGFQTFEVFSSYRKDNFYPYSNRMIILAT